MATNPDDRDHAAEVAALLLLATRRYDLPSLIRATKVKPTPFRRIAPTEALRAEMAAPYFEIVRMWRAERDALLAAYAAALPARGQQLSPGATARLQAVVDASALRITAALGSLERRFPGILARLERWHRVQWVARVKASTGLDVALFTTPQDVSPEISNAVTRNAQLAASLNSEIGHRTATTLLNALVAGTAVAIVARSLNGGFDQAKARAARFGVDQTEKAASGMSRARRVAAGLNRFRWRHDNDQRHPRPAHVARNLRTYTEATAPNDRAGTLPFCRCWEQPLWD